MNRITQSERDLLIAVGHRIKRVRKTRGWTLVQLGKAAEVGFQAIHKYECAAYRIPLAKLIRIAAALDVPVAYFLENHAPELTRPCQPSAPSANQSKA